MSKISPEIAARWRMARWDWLNKPDDPEAQRAYWMAEHEWYRAAEGLPPDPEVVARFQAGDFSDPPRAWDGLPWYQRAYLTAARFLPLPL